MKFFGKSVRQFGFLCLVVAVAATFFAFVKAPTGDASGKASETVRAVRKAPFFEENRGQFDPRVRFRAHGAEYDLWLTSTDAVYVVPDRSGKSTMATAVYMRLSGADPAAAASGTDERATRFNYLRGEKGSTSPTDVRTFAGTRVAGVYPGIDLVWRTNGENQLQYDFVAAPGADTGTIGWRIEGAGSSSLTPAGDLKIDTAFGSIVQKHPITYQESDGVRSEVESRFELRKDGSIGFVIGEHDPAKSLVIDPSVNLAQLASSTYLGSSTNEQALDIAVDAAGNTYTTGYTLSQLFPVTPGTFDTTQNANEDILVTKMNPSGTEIIFSTFIGGTGTEEARAILLDGSNNIYIAGYSTSTAYPTTAGAFDTTANGSADVVVTKLNPTGSTLIFSTLIGGSVFEEAFDLARDTSGNLYVTGRTNGGTFPVTVGAVDTTFNGVSDVFVAKLDQTGATLVYSTFIGGDANDFGEGIAVDSGGNAFVTGFTANGTVLDYPTTAGAFQTTYQGGTNDMFVTKLNASGSAFSYSTFIGGTDSDSANDIAVDSVGSAYVVGNVLNGGGFPTTVGAYDTTHNGALDIAVCKLNSTGSAMIFSTYIGGSGSEIGNAIAIDRTGSAYVAGYTLNSAINYPTTAGAFQTVHNGGHDAVLSRLGPTGAALLYSTMIGGSDDDNGDGLALDSSGNAYVVGRTTTNAATPFPTTPEAYQNYYGGGQDVFISKFGDHAIFGRALDTAGLPLANTALAMSGSRAGFTLADAQGYFGFTDTQFGGGFNVSATNTLYNFTPNTFTVAPLLGNSELNFVGRPTTSGPTAAFVDVGGRVESSVGSAPLGATTLTLIDTVHPNNIRTVASDSLGKYNFADVLAGGFYIVVPHRDGYTFNPGVYDLMLFEDQAALDFTATPDAPRPVQDFDGDGRTDLAVFRPADGNWYVLGSLDNSFKSFHFGAAGDVPLAEDYDGDRRADFAVYRPSEGNWYRQMSSDGSSVIHFGLGEDKPVPADFDGDGRADIAVFRPSTGVWHRLNSSDGGYVAEQFGIATDRPSPGDFDGDGKADLGICRDGVWYRRMSSDALVSITQFGIAGDSPFASDFDGDGRADIAVFRPSSGVWYWIGSIGGAISARQFGTNGDVPIPGDFDGDGRLDPAVYRSGTWHVMRVNGSDSVTTFGLGSDIPAPAAKFR